MKTASIIYIICLLLISLGAQASAVPLSIKDKTLPADCSEGSKAEWQEAQKIYASQGPARKDLNQKLWSRLEALQAKVALIGRSGQDLSSRSFENPQHFYSETTHKYSHVGLAYKEPQTQVWRIFHLITDIDRCGRLTSHSSIHDEPLETFFEDVLYKVDVVLRVPSAPVQESLLQTIIDFKDPATLLSTLHNPHYSSIANPFSLKRQNSNLFILALIATAQKSTDLCQKAVKEAKNKSSLGYISSRHQARWEALVCYKAQGFVPTVIKAPSYEGLGLSLIQGIKNLNWVQSIAPFAFRDEVALDDHSYQSQSSSRFPFASAASIFKYLKVSDPQANEAVEEELFSTRAQ